MSLAEFKQCLREQYFSLLLAPEAALAAIPEMLPADAEARTKMLAAIQRTVNAAGQVSGKRGERLAQIEALFSGEDIRKSSAKSALKMA
jgi:transcription antitermination factor NusA-like protein